MKALMQDCYIPNKKYESDIIDDEKHSFSFRETQLKESFEKEKKMIDQKFEQMKHHLDQRNHEILELKDIIRLKSQEYELLKQKFKDFEVDVLSGDNQLSEKKHHRFDSNYKSDFGSEHKSRSQSDNRSADNPIQPYQLHKKENQDLKNILHQLQEENNEFRAKLGLKPNYSIRRSMNDENELKRAQENDGTVVIGGMSHMGLNTTDENTSMRNYKIEMSPIEQQEKDVSVADEAILGVFDRSAGRNRGSKRKLYFDDNDNINKENIRSSATELDNIRSNKDILYKSTENLVDNLRQQLEDKQNIIEEMKNKLDYYKANSKDYSSPRFMEPEYLRNDKIRTQRLTADNIFKEIIKIFENSERIYELYNEKFAKQIDSERGKAELEQMSQHDSRFVENLNKDENTHLMQTLNNISSLSVKTKKNLDSLFTLIRATDEMKHATDSVIENEKRLLHVKSDKQLFLIKDLTEEVAKILTNSRLTKDEFDKVYNSLVSKSADSHKDNDDFEYSDYRSSKNDKFSLNRCNQLMGDMDDFISHLEQLFHELIDRSATIIDNSDLIEKNYIKLLKIANGKSDQKKKIDEMHALNEENLRTIMKLRKELICIKKANEDKETKIPHLPLENMEKERVRPHSVSGNEIPRSQSPARYMSSSMEANKNLDSFLSKRVQDAERKTERLTELLNEKEQINQALENEIMRKDKTIRSMHSTYESTHDKEHTDKQDLNLELQKQRKQYREQIDELNEQLDIKCQE